MGKTLVTPGSGQRPADARTTGPGDEEAPQAERERGAEGNREAGQAPRADRGPSRHRRTLRSLRRRRNAKNA